MSIKQINEIEAYWDSFSNIYITQDDTSNIFYLSLINMLKIENRNNILEVGAGAGFLYHHTLNRKKPEAKYIATDLSEKMLELMCKRLQLDIKLTEKNVIEKYNLIMQKANGEQLPFDDNSFDCYIANLCLQITTDPIKMLAESYRVLQKGGVAGFSVWGDKEKSSFFTLIPGVLNEFGIEQAAVRSNFHLNDREKLIKMMEEAGYTNIICWNQFAPFHHTTEEEMLRVFNSPGNALLIKQGGDKSEQIKERILSKVREILIEKKTPLGFDVLLIIGTKN